MVQGRGGSSLAPEAFEGLRVSRHIFRKKLQRDKPAKVGVFGLVHHPHAAAAQLLDDAVMGDRLADHCGGPWLCYEIRMVGLLTMSVNGKSAGRTFVAGTTLLLQLRVLRLGLLKGADVGIGLVPEREEILIAAFCFVCLAIHCIRSGKLQMSQRTQWKVHCKARMAENLLELRRRLVPFMQQQ